MSQQTTPICILGFGIAGQLLFLELLKAGVSPKAISILDQTALGGDLKTEYGPVISNTPWWKTKRALEAYPQWSSKAIEAGNTEFTDDVCMPVSRIADLCLQTATTPEHIQLQITTVLQAQPTPEGWTLTHTFGQLHCKLLFSCQGGLPKQLPVDLPTIPLAIALDSARLSAVVKPSDTVVVFGMSHSGVLLVKALCDLKIKTYGVYTSPQPFQFERDGVYSGLKECSAQIADAVLRGEYPTFTSVPYQDGLYLHKALKQATKVIVATGFSGKSIAGLPALYSPATAKLEGVERAYGFGIAYPGVTEKDGKVYSDVSVLSFQSQIQRCLPAILETHKDVLSQ